MPILAKDTVLGHSKITSKVPRKALMNRDKDAFVMIKQRKRRTAEFNIVREIITQFNLSVKDLAVLAKASSSSVYRWLGQSEKDIASSRFASLLDIYCELQVSRPKKCIQLDTDATGNND